MERTRTLRWSTLLLATSLPLTALANVPDSDGDGAPDDYDVQPCDASIASQLYAPGQNQSSLILFEDLWASPSGEVNDLDNNDAVLEYNATLDLDASGMPVRLSMFIHVNALGGWLDNGLALQLPVNASAIASATLSHGQGTAPTPVTADPAETQFTVVLSPNLRSLFGNAGGAINSRTDRPRVAGDGIKLDVLFRPEAGSIDMSLAPFDLFIFRPNNPAHEIHRPMYSGTTKMDNTLFGSGSDTSASGRYFTDANGIPSVVILPSGSDYPAEGVRISRMFPEILTWAGSGGTTAQNWYQNPATQAGLKYTDSLGNGPVVASAPGNTPVDRSCISSDPDNDGLNSAQEQAQGTDPYDPDSDSDGVLDGEEVNGLNGYTSNPLKSDTDDDGFTDYEEYYYHQTDPSNPDTDGDGENDYLEYQNTTDPLDPTSNYGTLDSDADGLTNAEETALGSDPFMVDTDGDLLSDYEEHHTYSTSMTSSDTDNDGLSDYDEVFTYYTDPKVGDTDNDGYSDYDEVLVWYTDPLNPADNPDSLGGTPGGGTPGGGTGTLDSDGDGLTDNEETNVYYTDPYQMDSDGDGLGDGDEVYVHMTTPSVWDSDGDGFSDGEELTVYFTDPNDMYSAPSGGGYTGGGTGADSDGDGLSDYDEDFVYYTNAYLADSDYDTLNDFDELFIYYTDPLNPDSDGDGKSDYEELFVFFTDPMTLD